MSIPTPSSEDAPGKPEVSPLSLAIDCQRTIDRFSRDAQVQAAMLRQLMRGRHVRVKGETTVYLVTEVRLSLGWKAILWGKAKSLRTRAIGQIGEVEVVETR